jgi:hypothetical protein
MLRIRPVLFALGAVMIGTGCLACSGSSSSGQASGGASSGATSTAQGAATMCQAYQSTNVDGGAYTVQTDEWDSKAAQCVSTSGGAGFTVTKSALANSAGGDPGSYPSIYAGCNWGDCTQAGLAAHPQEVSALGPGDVTTSLATTDPAGGAYDVSYDIWFNQTPTTSGAPNGLEVMVWLNNHGGVQPAGSVVQSNVQLGGYTYDIWYSSNAGNGPCVTYEMTTTRSTVSNLDLAPLLANAEQHGVLQSSWYLIAVEAGFEIWQGGTGLAVNGFSVSLGSGAGSTS